MEAIFKRRSIRKYKDIPVTPEQREKLLRAGMAAPSSENDQEWQFIEIRAQELKQKVMEMDPYAGALRTAPLCFLLCADKRHVSCPDDIYWVQDLSAAAQNMLLQAADMELGGLWMGLDDSIRAGLSELLSLPAYIDPLILLAFGTPDEEKKPIDRYLADRVHVDGFTETE